MKWKWMSVQKSSTKRKTSQYTRMESPAGQAAYAKGFSVAAYGKVNNHGKWLK